MDPLTGAQLQAAVALLTPDNGAAATKAAQPGIVAGFQNGLFGGPFSASLANQSAAVFQNQSAGALAALNSDGADFGEGLVGKLFNSTLAPLTGGSTSALSWVPLALLVVGILSLFKKH